MILELIKFSGPEIVLAVIGGFFGLMYLINSIKPRRGPAIPLERWANSGTNNESLPNQVVL